MPTRKYPSRYKELFFFFNYKCLLENVHLDIKKREIKLKNKLNLKNELWINLLLALKKTQKIINIT